MSVSANVLRSATGKSGRATSMAMMPTFFSRAAISAAAIVARRHVVVVPEAQVDDLVPREQLPHLRREDAEVRARVGGRLGSGMAGQDVQHARPELAVLILLAPDARRQIHQRRERAVGAAERPHARELVGIDRGALADQPDGRRGVARFLNRGLETRAGRIRLGIVVAPEAAVLEVDRLRQVGGDRRARGCR